MVASDALITLAALGAAELLAAWAFAPALLTQRQFTLSASGVVGLAIVGVALRSIAKRGDKGRDLRSISARSLRARQLTRVAVAIATVWVLVALAPEFVPGGRAGFGSLQILTAAVGVAGLIIIVGVRFYLTNLAPVTMPLASPSSTVSMPRGVEVHDTPPPSGEALDGAIQVISDNVGPTFGSWWSSPTSARLTALSSLIVVIGQSGSYEESGSIAVHLARDCSQGCRSSINLDPSTTWSVAALEGADRPVAVLQASVPAQAVTGRECDEIVEALIRNRVPGGFVEILPGKWRGRTHLSRY
jgi:hypothetical protein